MNVQTTTLALTGSMRATSIPRTSWWALPILLGLAFVVFWPVLGLTPFSDDHSALWNAGVRGIPWRTGIYRPLADLTFEWGTALWASSAFGHRTFNVLAHGLNAFLLFVLFIRIAKRHGLDNAQNGAWIAALLFLVYPFHQESIVWLVGRESALGTFFTLIGLLAVANERVGWLQLAIASLALFTGLLCYEGTLLLPLLAIPILYSRGFGQAHASRMLLGFGAALIAFMGVHVVVGSQVESSYFGGLFSQHISAYLMNIPKVMARLFLPPVAEPSTMIQCGIMLGLVVLAAFLGIRFLPRKSERTRANGLVAALLLLLVIACLQPVLGGVSTHTSESDRFLYLPSVFLCMLAGILILSIPQRLVRMVVFGVLLIVSTLALLSNHAHWRSASATTTRILSELPNPPAQGLLFVSGLPDNDRGAFIFRNGFREAVWLSGGDGDRYIEAKDRTPSDTVDFRGRRFVVGAQDEWVIWGVDGFRERK